MPWQPAARPRRHRLRPILLGALALVPVLAAGAVAGANAYAKHEVCTALKGGSFTGPGRPTSTDRPNTTQTRRAADELRGSARLLVLDRDLKSAVNGLADDVDQLGDLLGAAEDNGLGRLMLLAASINDHVRQAQRACGLPVRGIFTD